MGVLDRQSFAIAFFSAVSMLSTTGFQAILMHRAGLSDAVDTFVAAATIPQLLGVIILTVLPAVLVPVFSVEKEHSQIALAATVLSRLLALLCGAAGLLCLASAPMGRALFPALSAADHGALQSLQIVLLLGVPAHGVIAVCSSVMHARRQFLRNAQLLAGFPLVVTSLLLWCPLDSGLVGAAALQSGGFLLQAAMMMKTTGIARGWSLERADIKTLRAIQTKSRPMLVGAGYAKTETLLDRHLLSGTDAGELAAFAFVRQLLEAFAGLLTRSHVATVLPSLSAAAGGNSPDEFRAIYRECLKKITFLSLMLLGLLGLFAVLFSENLVEDNQPMVSVVSFVSLGAMLSGVLLFAVTGGLAANAFYALGDTRTPTLVGISGFTGFMILKILIFPVFGVPGLAIASSAYFATNASMLALLLRRKLLGWGA